MLDVLDLCSCGSLTLSLVILRCDDHAAELDHTNTVANFEFERSIATAGEQEPAMSVHGAAVRKRREPERRMEDESDHGIESPAASIGSSPVSADRRVQLHGAIQPDSVAVSVFGASARSLQRERREESRIEVDGRDDPENEVGATAAKRLAHRGDTGSFRSGA